MWLPPDDYALPRLLERVVAVLDAHPDVACCVPQIEFHRTTTVRWPAEGTFALVGHAEREPAPLTSATRGTTRASTDSTIDGGAAPCPADLGLSRLRLDRVGGDAADRQAPGSSTKKSSWYGRPAIPTRYNADDRPGCSRHPPSAHAALLPFTRAALFGPSRCRRGPSTLAAAIPAEPRLPRHVTCRVSVSAVRQR